MSIACQIINVNEYELLTNEKDFTAAIEAVADRTRREGHPGVLSYQFFVDAPLNLASACITYADADAWVAHHEMVYGWDEMPAFQKNVRLTRASLFGPLNARMRAMLESANLQCEVLRVSTHAAGFNRSRRP